MMASSSSVTSPQAKIGTTGALLLFHLLVATTLGGAPVALPGCPDTCGSISIPYPFGVGHGCFYREGFNLTCDEAHQPPKLFLDHNVQVLDISLPDATVRISREIPKSNSLEFNGSWSVPMASGPLTVSTAHNWFVAFGCNMVAQLIPYDTLGSYEYTSICAAVCSPCSRSQPCRTSIAWGRSSYSIVVRHLEACILTSDPRIERYVFIVDQDWFSRNQNWMVANFCLVGSTGLTGSLPVVLEWSLDLIVDQRLFTLNKSSDWRCLSLNSFSYDVNGYDQRRCNCSQGYEGNPYFADGCQDINECQQPDAYPCHGTCINEPGTYQCLSKKSISGHPELLTRMRPVFSSQSSENTSLTAYFISLLRDNRLSDILDPQIVEEGRVEEAELVARLTEACLSFKGEERPTMRQVEMRLEEVQVSEVHLNSQVARDTKVSRNVLRDQPCKRGKGSEGTRVYSLEKEFLASSEFPRKTRRVEMMTDANGAPADIQKSFGHFMLCVQAP